MGSNSLRDEGTIAVCNALEQSKVSKLEELLIHGNSIGADGAKAVGAFCAVSGSLTQLDLDGNNLGAEGAKALASALRNSEGCKLKKLNADMSSYRDPDLVAACKLRGIKLT